MINKRIIKESIKKELKEFKRLISEAPFGRAKGLDKMDRKSVTGDNEALANARAEMAIDLIKKNLSSMGIDIPDVSDQTTIGYYKSLKNFPVKFKIDKRVPEVFGDDTIVKGTTSVDSRSTADKFVMYLNYDLGGKKSTAQILFDKESLMQNLRGTDKELPMLLKGVKYKVKFRNKNIESGTALFRVVGSKKTFNTSLDRIKRLYQFTNKEGNDFSVIIDYNMTKKIPKKIKERVGDAVVVRDIVNNELISGVKSKSKLKRVRDEGEKISAFKQEDGTWEAVVKVVDSSEQIRKITFIELPENKFGKGFDGDDNESKDWVYGKGNISSIETKDGESWNTGTLETVINNRLNSGKIKVRKSYTKEDTLILSYDSIRRDLGTDAVLVSAPNIVNDFNGIGLLSKKVKVGPKAGGRDNFEEEGVANITLKKLN